MMFSIVIPLYNKAKFISATILSVLNQTFAEYELIIVNDGSTDNSADIIEKYSDKRIRKINQQNKGVSTARNCGVNAANFNYIAFLDADDWWDKYFLEEIKNLIERYPQEGLYGIRYWYVKNNQKRLTNVGLPKNFDSGYINYFNTYSKTFTVPLNCSFVVINKNAFNEVGGFNSQLKFGEDFDLWVRIALKQNVVYLNKPLAFSNQDVNTQNRALGEKIWAPENHYVFNLEYLAEEESSNRELKKLLDGLRVRALLRYHLSGKYKKERKKILSKIDFSKQPKYYQRIYKWPLVVIKLYFIVKKTGSFFKQKLIKLVN